VHSETMVNLGYGAESGILGRGGRRGKVVCRVTGLRRSWKSFEVGEMVDRKVRTSLKDVNE